ncbi:MAG: lipase maturation factor family protein [Deltaproteobacteria bacterium]|nr:lipase maturation factor family protein [Deltaproteobacteria bacterium]
MPPDAPIDDAHTPAPPTYWLTRFVILRLLGVVYFAAFLSLARQVLPLIGAHGLLPAAAFLARVGERFGSPLDQFLVLPSVFWVSTADPLLVVAAWTGVALLLVVALGFANALVMAVLWALYLSFIHIGQDWYGYGWEIQLCETGFLAVFLCPLLDARPFPRRPPPVAVIWLYRWLIVRIMLGAGLIKLRGDSCWRTLTCLYYHYETQPIPNPLSRTLHFMPRWFHQLGVLFNHAAELVAPWFAFGPRHARHIAGAVMLALQIILILSGNLSFLNWLTIVPLLACFDDSLLRHVLPAGLGRAAGRAAAVARPARAQQLAVVALVALVAFLSIGPIRNLLATHQVMNTSFDPFALVNTYGAFGSVGRARDEIVFEGTTDAVPDDDARWKAYEFPCKPGDPLRRPCVVAPYQPRLDWQIWFAAMSTPERYPWTLHLVWKLLHNDAGALSLLAGNPFPDAPPRFIRARFYRYAFAPPDDPSGAWWTRTLVGEWLPPLSRDDARLRRFLAAYGWPTDE